MARQLRMEYEGAIDHVMNRCERIFRDDEDRGRFGRALGETCELDVAPPEREGGWPTGFEPATTGITIRGSAIELRPPSAQAECLREGRGGVKQGKSGKVES